MIGGHPFVLLAVYAAGFLGQKRLTPLLLLLLVLMPHASMQDAAAG
jgi:hypothetical protein